MTARPLGRVLRFAGFALVGLAALAALPVVLVETVCRADTAAPPTAAYEPLVGDAGYRRDEIRSYLSYPEWYIVHAYEDFAGVLRIGTESDFAYLSSIRGFWTSLCGSNRVASRAGQSNAEIKTMLYTIGLSFTAEMAVKGLYESTIGRITAGLRGPERTEEDRFALRLAESYAAFLQQRPWYEFPFGSELGRFWRETPLSGPGLLRKLERRVSLSLEYGAKAAYAALLGYAAGLAPAELRIGSVVEGLDATTIAADGRIRYIRDVGGGRSLIETPRYREFTEIVRVLSGRGVRLVEIAGNDDVLITALVPRPLSTAPEGAKAIFVLPIQSRSGWQRVGLDTKVSSLSGLFRKLEDEGGVLEHIYDY